MTPLPYLKDIFDKLRQGAYITHEHGEIHAALVGRADEYTKYFEPLGLDLVQHERDFFYFRTETAENTPAAASLPPIIVFSFILIEAAADEGHPVEEYLLTTRFDITKLPHLASDRYKEYLKLMDIENDGALLRVVKSMVRLGWVEFNSDQTFRFLRPFYRVFDKCREISQEMGENFSLASGPNEELETE